MQMVGNGDLNWGSRAEKIVPQETFVPLTFPALALAGPASPAWVLSASWGKKYDKPRPGAASMV